MNEGVTFHLYGYFPQRHSGGRICCDGCFRNAVFEDVLIGTGYTVGGSRYRGQIRGPRRPEAAVEWNKVTEKSFSNILKKFCATVTKSDSETDPLRVMLPLLEQRTESYKDGQLMMSTTRTKTVSLPPAIMSAAVAGLSVRSLLRRISARFHRLSCRR